MKTKEQIEIYFGIAMEDVAEDAYARHIQNKEWYDGKYAYGKLQAIGNILELDFDQIREINIQQIDMVLLGQ